MATKKKQAKTFSRSTPTQPRPGDVTVTLSLSQDHLYAMQRACEFLARCGMGQFSDLAELFLWDGEKHASNWHEATRVFETVARYTLRPGLVGRGHHYPIRNDAVPKPCRHAWEVYNSVRYSLAHATAERDGGYGDGWRGVPFDEPFACSGDPLPACTVTVTGGEQ